MSYYSKFPMLFASRSSYAPASEAYFAAMTTQLDDARKEAIDEFIRGLITDGIYSKLDYGVIHGLPLEQQALVSFTPGNPVLLKIGSPTFVANEGWVSVGSNASRLDTPANYDTFANFQQNSASYGTYLLTAPNQNAIAMGTSDGKNRIVPNYVGTHKYARINMTSNPPLNLGGGGTGLQAVDRSGASAWTFYKNGFSHGSGTTASSAPTSVPFSILNENGAVAANNNKHAFSFIGGSLTPTEHDNLALRFDYLWLDLVFITANE